MSKVKGSSNTSSSRLAEAYQRVTRSPALIVRAPDLDVDRGPAGEVAHRGGPPQHLVDRPLGERGIGAQPRDLLGLVDERRQPGREGIAGRLAARPGEQHEEEVELGLAEPLAVDLDGGERRPHVVGRVGPLVAAQVLGVLEHLHLVAQGLVRAQTTARRRRGEEGPGQGEEPLPVGLRDADDVGDHVHRQRVGHLAHEVDLPLGQGVVDQPPGPPPALLLELGDAPRREPGADQTALAHVVAPVHAHQHHPAHGGHVGQPRPVDGAEALHVPVDRLHICVAGQHPHPGLGRGRHLVLEGVPVHRVLGPQGGEHLVGEAVLVEAVVGQIDHRGHLRVHGRGGEQARRRITAPRPAGHQGHQQVDVAAPLGGGADAGGQQAEEAGEEHGGQVDGVGGPPPGPEGLDQDQGHRVVVEVAGHLGPELGGAQVAGEPPPQALLGPEDRGGDGVEDLGDRGVVVDPLGDVGRDALLLDEEQLAEDPVLAVEVDVEPAPGQPGPLRDDGDLGGGEAGAPELPDALLDQAGPGGGPLRLAAAGRRRIAARAWLGVGSHAHRLNANARHRRASPTFLR